MENRSIFRKKDPEAIKQCIRINRDVWIFFTEIIGQASDMGISSQLPRLEVDGNRQRNSAVSRTSREARVMKIESLIFDLGNIIVLRLANGCCPAEFRPETENFRCKTSED